MKINKLILVAVLGTCLVGCNTQNDGKDNPNNVTTPPVVDNDKKEAVIENYYGQISSVVGNEINLSLAKAPDSEIEVPEPNPDGSFDAIAMVPASGTDSDDTKGANERKELDFTGEDQDFIIPTGTIIKNTMSSEVKIDALKKGSIISIEYDSTNKKVLSVTVSE